MTAVKQKPRSRAAAGAAASDIAASRLAGAEGSGGAEAATRPLRKEKSEAFDRPTRRSRKTRLALVNAARRLLEEQGVAALTVKAVTDLADVGHGTFYHHFPSTEAVLAAGIEQSMREFAEALERGFADAEDKGWVFVASLASTFRMLAAHPALPWMLERPQILAAALRDACGPFAQRDVVAMLAAGEIATDAPRRAAWWEWLIVGAVSEVSADASRRSAVEARLVEMVLRILGLAEPRIAALLGRLQGAGQLFGAPDGDAAGASAQKGSGR